MVTLVFTDTKHKTISYVSINLVFNKAISRSLIQLLDQLLTSFEEHKFTLGIFTQFKRDSDLADCSILLTELSRCDIEVTSRKCFEKKKKKKKKSHKSHAIH